MWDEHLEESQTPKEEILEASKHYMYACMLTITSMCFFSRFKTAATALHTQLHRKCLYAIAFQFLFAATKTSKSVPTGQ